MWLSDLLLAVSLGSQWCICPLIQLGKVWVRFPNLCGFLTIRKPHVVVIVPFACRSNLSDS